MSIILQPSLKNICMSLFFFFFLPVKEERLRVIYEKEQNYELTHHYMGQKALE